MGSNFNFRNFETDLSGEMANGERPPGNIPLTRQSSVYSLTFDEFQSAVGGIGKDLGSMNMDELLKNIWTAEENQNIGSSSGVYGIGQEGGGYLQRQGSLTLPRTLSQKTVDQVWHDISKEFDGGKDTVGNMSGFNIPQKQKTLGEVTLEEFLVRAGVVREEAQLAVKPSNDCFSSEYSSDVKNSWLGFGYQQPQTRGGAAGLASGSITERSNHTAKQSANLPLNVNGARAAARQLGAQQHLAQQVQPQQQPQILPKQPTVAYGAAIEIPSGQFESSGMRGDTVGIPDPSISRSMVQNAASQGGGIGIAGFGANGVTAAAGSPAVSSDGLTSNGDTSSVSPVPYVFNGSLRGRRSAALEKVVERRQRRMIKNRESAARSRARKQAYTMELEAEIAKLKEENELLQKKQADMMEMQKKNQVLEMMNQQKGSKRRCLRRTQTGPW